MNTKKEKRRTLADKTMESKPAMLVMAVLSICFGLFFIFFVPSGNEPVSREEAISYEGKFEKYQSFSKYCDIVFDDGSKYSIYPHTETKEFRDTMEALEKGTTLYILVNPNNDYVAEVKTDSEELLNFETSQKEIYSYQKGYIGIGIFVCACGVFLVLYAILQSASERKEADRRRRKKERKIEGKEDSAIRFADFSKKGKILLEKSVQGYKICYRRVKSTNELIINGKVYDDKKALIEFEHRLSATLDNHIIAAGLDKDDYSYIIFDGKRVAEKKRLI